MEKLFEHSDSGLKWGCFIWYYRIIVYSYFIYWLSIIKTLREDTTTSLDNIEVKNEFKVDLRIIQNEIVQPLVRK